MLQHTLMSLAQTEALIKSGRPCCVAADEALLRKLPPGRWIGGTIPYFMADRGGTCTRDELFVCEVPDVGEGPRIVRYDRHALASVCTDGPDHGFTLLVLPAFTPVHEAFAQEAPGYTDMYMRPLVGWVSGVHLNDIGKVGAKVFHGPTGEALDGEGVALHVPVSASQMVHVDIVNLFGQNGGPDIEFPEGGFSAGDCTVDGKASNLHDWLLEKKIDTKLPLVADYCGASINVCIKNLDAAERRVDFYAPVFPGTKYRVANNVPDYVGAFREAITRAQAPGELVFSCNCVLNYAYGGLEGHNIGAMPGPVTFGEIGYQLLNQTLVYLSLVDA